MVRVITIVEELKPEGRLNYTANGDLPLEDAARALVILALHTELPKQEPIKKEVIIDPAGDTIG